MNYDEILIGDIVKVPANVDSAVSTGYTAKVVDKYKHFVSLQPFGKPFRTSISKVDVGRLVLVKHDPKEVAKQRYNAVLDVVTDLQKHLAEN